MSGFLKKLSSRSRGNSASYVEDDYHRQSASPTTGAGQRPPSSYHNPANFRDDTGIDTNIGAPHQVGDNVSRSQPGTPKEPMYTANAAGGGGYAAARTAPLQTNGMRASRGQSSAGDSGYADGPASPMLAKEAAFSGGMSGGGQGGATMGAPDLLTRAFNEAIRPYTEKIELLEGELQDMQDFMRSQEQQRAEIFAWIDKRGLRPGELSRFFTHFGISPTNTIQTYRLRLPP